MSAIQTKKETELQETSPVFLVFQKSVVIVAIILIWWFVPQFTKDNMYVPSLKTVLAELGRVIANGEYLVNVLATMKIAVIGLILATAIAIPLGIVLGWYKTAEQFLDPVLQFMRNTPIMAILPLFVLFFGIGDVSKIIIIVWATFFPTLINTVQGVKNTDPTLIRSARSMGIGNGGLFVKVVLPSALPYILAGLRLSAGVTLIIVIAAELLGAKNGIGLMITKAQHAYMIPKMYAYILTIAIIGVITNALLLKLERYLTRWQEKAVNV
jgi:NitT/TauT family transport system permease protein